MNTWAVISVKQDNCYKSISVEANGYPLSGGVGNVLTLYHYTQKKAEDLINKGNKKFLIPRDFDIENLSRFQRDANLHEDMKKISDVKTTKEVFDYCIYEMPKTVGYLYVFEDGIWSFTKVDNKSGTKEYSLVELRISDTSDIPDVRMVDVPFYCSYRTAASWGGTQMVLLNNIMDIDPYFDPYIDFPGDQGMDEDEIIPEFYQYYITNKSDDDIEWAGNAFPSLIYSYSDILNAWVLCVDHYGTSWDYVATQFNGDLHISEDEFKKFNK